MAQPAFRNVLLLGAGHGHLDLMKHLNELTGQGVRVTVVSPEPIGLYSGMIPGLLGGRYDRAAVSLPVREIVEQAGGSFVEDVVIGIEASTRTVRLASGRELSWDVLSVAMGSVVATDRLPEVEGGPADGVFPVKPFANLEAARDRVRELLATRDARAVVVGGGPAAVEIAGNLARLGREAARAGTTDTTGGSAHGTGTTDTTGGTAHGTGTTDTTRGPAHGTGTTDTTGGSAPGADTTGSRGRLEVALVCGGEPLARFSGSCRRRALMALQRDGVLLCRGPRARHVSPGRVVLADGYEEHADVIILAPGVTPPPILAASGLPTAADGALVIDAAMRVSTDPPVFAAGDSSHLEGRPLARIGAHALRGGKALRRNLIELVLLGEVNRPARYAPRRGIFLALNMGNGRAAACFQGASLFGRWVFALKEHIDTTFMRNTRRRLENRGTDVKRRQSVAGQ
ncbi:MAG: FAD-dependent oxidoreductase [Spirochaetia bacterium]